MHIRCRATVSTRSRTPCIRAIPEGKRTVNEALATSTLICQVSITGCQSGRNEDNSGTVHTWLLQATSMPTADVCEAAALKPFVVALSSKPSASAARGVAGTELLMQNNGDGCDSVCLSQSGPSASLVIPPPNSVRQTPQKQQTRKEHGRQRHTRTVATRT